MVEDFHVGADLAAATSDGADGVRIQEPVQHVEIVAILLDDEVAGVIAIAEPVAQLLDLRVGIRHARERIAADPISTRVHELADIAGLKALERFQVNGAVALLETEPRFLLGSHFLPAAMTRRTPSMFTPAGFSQ